MRLANHPEHLDLVTLEADDRQTPLLAWLALGAIEVASTRGSEQYEPEVSASLRKIAGHIARDSLEESVPVEVLDAIVNAADHHGDDQTVPIEEDDTGERLVAGPVVYVDESGILPSQALLGEIRDFLVPPGDN